MKSIDVSVVIPVYNERDNVALLHTALVDALAETARSWEVVLVDDGSTDGSREELQRLADLDSRVRGVELSRNFGQTAALSAGIAHARGDVIVTMDADLQNDPADIPHMLEKLDEGYDLVHGWRRDRQDAFLNRRLPSLLANWLISRVTGFPVRDLGCTLKAIRAEFARELNMYGEMHRFIPILAHWQGARCREVVTRHHPRRFGESKYGIWRTVRVLLDLLTVKFLIGYASSPMRLFGGIGLLGLMASAASFVGTAGMKIFGGTDMTGNPLLLLSVVSGMVAIQFFVLGLLGEVAIRTYHECQNKPPYRVRRVLGRAQSGVRQFAEAKAA